MSLKVIPVNEDTYCVYRASYFNCSYIVKRENGIVLIDTGMKSSGKDVIDAFQELNLKLETIKGILLTHWHNDHAAGTSVVKALTNCQTFAHHLERPYFEEKQSNKFRQLADFIPERGIMVMFKGLIGDTVPKKVQIDQLVADGDLVLEDFEVIESPGHTPGHLAFYDKKQKTLFAGDAFAVIRNQLRLMAGPVTPDKEKSLESINKIFQNREINYICPGHRQPLTQGVPEEIQRFLSYLKTMKKWPLLG